MHFTEPLPGFSQEFFRLTGQARRVLITGHMSPDDDSIASVLGVREILRQAQPKQNVRIVYSAKADERFYSFKHYRDIEFVQDIAAVIRPSDTLIIVDGSQFHRFSLTPEKLKSAHTTICIDHHASPADNFTLSLIAPAYPAAAELIYRAFRTAIRLDTQVAEIFLLGILGDTNTFKYLKPSTSGTLEIAKELIDAGQIDIQNLQARFDYILLRQFEVLQEFIKNTRFAQVPHWPDFQYSFITRAFAKSKNYTVEELSGGTGLYKSAYLSNIQGYAWGFTVRPEGRDMAISGRSLPGSVNVRDFMERLMIGGGHDRAAGGRLKTDADAEQAASYLLRWMAKNKPVLS